MPTPVKKAHWPAKPLPRGRHTLSMRTVRSSQRARLITAMLARVAAQGYAKTTVSGVAAAARVSPNVFYDFFADKDECFLAACEEQAAELLGEITAAPAGAGWVERTRLGVAAYLRWWQERPELTRAYFLEMPMAGERAMAQRQRAYEPFARMFAQLGALARRERRDLPTLPAFVPGMLAISITEFVAAEVRLGRTARLMPLKDDLTFYLVKLLADEASARRALPGISN